MRRYVSILALLAFGAMVAGCETETATNNEQETNEKDTVELKTVTNSIGMKLKLIPAGAFTSSWAGTRGDLNDTIIANPFYLGVTEVTQQQYETVMGRNPSSFSMTGRSADWVRGMDTSNFPVESVTLDEAVEFCKKLSAMEGETYRLPLDHEWEYACRAGSTAWYCFGSDPNQLAEYAWFGDNSDGRTHSVGKKKSNAWGLHDMHGNVWEWTTMGMIGMLPSTRGGSWERGHGQLRSADFCTSSSRGGHGRLARRAGLGFRVAREAV